MATKKPQVLVETGSEVVDELHVADESVEYTDVTDKDDLPAGVSDVKADEDEPKAKPTKQAAVKTDGDVPEELRGKTPAQLAKMYRDAQTVIGRQGSELGDLRRAADKYITAHLTRAAQPVTVKAVEPKQLDDVDFFTDPTGSIQRAVESHPVVKELQGQAKASAIREMTRQRTDAANSFKAKHPDAEAVVNDPEFRAWIGKSPLRQAMLLRAHQQYDLVSGEEVFSTWKEIKALRAPKTEVDEPKAAGDKTVTRPTADRKAARVPTGGNATPRSSEQGGGKEGKIYRRADIIRLMENDPHRYELMSDEITKAYQDGRVR